MSDRSIRQKLGEAIRVLYEGREDEPLASRLFWAGVPLVELQSRPNIAFPTPDLQRRFVAIMDRLTRTAATGKEGTLRASVNAMSEDERRQLSDDIFTLNLDTGALFTEDES